MLTAAAPPPLAAPEACILSRGAALASASQRDASEWITPTSVLLHAACGARPGTLSEGQLGGAAAAAAAPPAIGDGAAETIYSCL